jgi:hypothetical protein
LGISLRRRGIRVEVATIERHSGSEAIAGAIRRSAYRRQRWARSTSRQPTPTDRSGSS